MTDKVILNGEYEEVVDAGEEFFIQNSGGSRIRFFIGTTAPADDTQDYFILKSGQTAFRIISGKVFARADTDVATLTVSKE
jgi:hypothetical protein